MLSCCGVTGGITLAGKIFLMIVCVLLLGACAHSQTWGAPATQQTAAAAQTTAASTPAQATANPYPRRAAGSTASKQALRGKLGARIPLSFGRVPAMPAAELRNTGQQRQRRRQWRGHGAADVQSADRVSGRGPDLPAGRGALRIWTYFRGRRRSTGGLDFSLAAGTRRPAGASPCSAHSSHRPPVSKRGYSWICATTVASSITVRRRETSR